MQQLGLQWRGDCAEFVEEQRPLVRELELAGPVLHRAAERPPLEAEQLGFEHVGRQTGAVHLHEGPVAPARIAVDCAGHQFLAATPLAAYQHRKIRLSHPIDQLADADHALAAPVEQCVTGLALQLLAQLGHLAAQLSLPQRTQERRFEIRFIEGLAHEVDRSQLHRLDDRGCAALAGEHEDRHGAIDLAKRCKRRESIHVPRHHEIENHRRRRRYLKPSDCLICRLHRFGLVAAATQEFGQELAHGWVVIYDHDADGIRHGIQSGDHCARGDCAAEECPHS